jgi:FimV-like protein
MHFSAQLPLYLEFLSYVFKPIIAFFAHDSVAFYLLLTTQFLIIALLTAMIIRQKSQNRFDSNVVTAIAGENLAATQLDLAKAYIEMDQKTLARQVLKDVTKQGNKPQKQEARLLMKSL